MRRRNPTAYGHMVHVLSFKWLIHIQNGGHIYVCIYIYIYICVIIYPTADRQNFLIVRFGRTHSRAFLKILNLKL